MTRVIDATLTAALASGKGKPHLVGYIGYADGTVIASAPVIRYKLTGHSLEFEIDYNADIGSDQECIWLERGVIIAGTTYTLTTGRFRIMSQRYTPDNRQVVTAALFPKQYYTAGGYDTYKNIIDAFCANFGKTAVYRDAAAAWLDYQFMPVGKSIILNDANLFANLLRQKYLIFMADNGSEEILFYSCEGSLAGVDHTLAPVNDFYQETSYRSSRLLVWRDEVETIHTSGEVTDPIHNLGYLESTDDPPARTSAPALFEARIRPDLRIIDGDVVQVDAFGAQQNGFALVTEEFEPASRSHPLPRWELTITANEVFSNTAGGAMPSTIERVSNYTPLNTSMFNGILSENDNNLQAAMDTLDDHAHAGAGDWELVQDFPPGADVANFDFTNIPQTYKHLKLILNVRTDRAGNAIDNVGLQFNGDTTGSYNSMRGAISHNAAVTTGENLAASSLQCAIAAGASATAGMLLANEILIPDYASTGTYHSANMTGGGGTALTTGQVNFRFGAGFWRNTASAISRITVIPISGTVFKGISRATLYGMK